MAAVDAATLRLAPTPAHVRRAGGLAASNAVIRLGAIALFVYARRMVQRGALT